MRVLFMASDLSFPPHGGRSQRTFNTLREAASRHEVHFVSFDQGYLRKTEQDRETALAKLREFCASVHAFQLPVKFSRSAVPRAVVSSLVSRDPYSAVIYRHCGMTAAVQRILREHQIELFHVDSTDMGLYRHLAGAIPSVVVHHNVESVLMRRRADQDTFLPRKMFMSLEASKLSRFEERLADLFDVHIVMSEVDGRVLERVVPKEKIRVVPNGVDLNYFRPDPSVEIDSDSIVHVGGLNWFPNADGIRYFLDSMWDKVLARRPNARLRLVGAHPTPDLLERADGERLQVLGYVEDMRPIVAQSAVYVVPLRMGGGTRLKILDAMAMGKPVVTSTVGCEGIAVSPGTDILVGDTPEEFAAQVVSMLEDTDRRRSIAHAARATVERHYGWPFIGEQLEAAYVAACRTESAARLGGAPVAQG